MAAAGTAMFDRRDHDRFQLNGVSMERRWVAACVIAYLHTIILASQINPRKAVHHNVPPRYPYKQDSKDRLSKTKQKVQKMQFSNRSPNKISHSLQGRKAIRRSTMETTQKETHQQNSYTKDMKPCEISKAKHCQSANYNKNTQILGRQINPK